MQPIVLTAVVDEKRRIMIDLPDDLPVGPIELVIRPLTAKGDHKMTREEIRARLIAAGHLSNLSTSPDALDVSQDERFRLASLLTNQRPISETIIEDREERF
jgi:hypothetical protein